MNYSARKVYVTCGRDDVQAWAAYMRAHMEQVRQSLRRERVRHEAWFLGQDGEGLFLIGVMDADDHAAAAAAAAASPLPVDRVHRNLKRHWDRTRMAQVPVAPNRPPAFDACELLLDARA